MEGGVEVVEGEDLDATRWEVVGAPDPVFGLAEADVHLDGRKVRVELEWG